MVVACITRTPGVGADAAATGSGPDAAADVFRRFLRCVAGTYTRPRYGST